MLSLHRLENPTFRNERDAIYRWVKDNCPNEVNDNETLIHICFMDGGRIAVRLSLYPEFLALVHQHGRPNGLKYYFVERLPESRVARLYIDLDLYVASEDMIPSDRIMRGVTRVIQKAAQEAWRLEAVPPYAVASATPRPEDRYIGKTTRKLKRMDTSDADLAAFFAREEYEQTVVFKVGVHWIFPSIVDHSDNLRAFAHHLKSVLNRKVDPMPLFGVVTAWDDAVDLGIYKGDGRGAFRLPFCHKAKPCPEKPAFRFNPESRRYVPTEEGGSRPPTMQCGKVPPYQGDVRSMAQKYNSGFRGRVVTSDKRLPDETDVQIVPVFVGKGRAKKLFAQGIKTVVVEGVELSVRCAKCLNEGYVSMPTYYVPCDWSELQQPTDFSIVPFGRIDKPLDSFDVTLVGNMNKYVAKSAKGVRRKLQTETTRASKKIARGDKLQEIDSFALPPNVSSLFVKMMKAATYKHKGVPYQPFKDSAHTMEFSFKIHYRKGVPTSKLVENLQMRDDPPVRLWVYDETSFCPFRFCKHGKSNCHHASNRSYVEVSCLGFKTQCLDTDDPICYPNGRKRRQLWRTNDHSKKFWQAFVVQGLRGPLSLANLGFNITDVEWRGMRPSSFFKHQQKYPKYQKK